jgi:ParB-like chromosome segregation protein Spo0J
MIKQVRVAHLKRNPNNPRIIKGDKFYKLVQSVKDFPEMLSVRPIVVNQDMVVLGGNMRLKAIQEANIKEVTVEVVDWDLDKQAEFIIKDNINFGEWDFDALANEWTNEPLEQWGLDVWKEQEASIEEEVEDQDSTSDDDPKEVVNRIVLEYSDQDHERVTKALNKLGGTKESAIFRLLFPE